MTILDGGMGTMLQARARELPKYAETVNLTEPEAVTAIHREYAEAGSEIIVANTFSCTALRAERGNYDLGAVVRAAIRNAKAAGAARVALDVGPLGDFLEPYGELTEAEARASFRALAEAGREADLWYIETMDDPRQALLAAEELLAAADKPLFATFTFARGGRTITGATSADCARVMGPVCTALGLNCSLGPVEALPLVEAFRAASDKPLIAKPNAGMPGPDGRYSMSPAAFAAAMLPLRAAGADLLGGCCGTTPAFIAALKEALA